MLGKFTKTKIATRKIIVDSIHKGMAKKVGHSNMHNISFKSKTKGVKLNGK